MKRTTQKPIAPRHCPPKRLGRGVTLLELVAVVVITGLLASTSLIGFQRSLTNAKNRQAVDQFLFYDNQCRTLADRTNQTVTLQYNSQTGQLFRTQLGKTTALVGGLNLPDIWAPQSLTEANTIHYFSNGTSGTYGLTTHDKQLMLVTGATGQVTRFDSLSAARKFIDEATGSSRTVVD